MLDVGMPYRRQPFEPRHVCREARMTIDIDEVLSAEDWHLLRIDSGNPLAAKAHLVFLRGPVRQYFQRLHLYVVAILIESAQSAPLIRKPVSAAHIHKGI